MNLAAELAKKAPQPRSERVTEWLKAEKSKTA
jgi:hypothetical protein